MRSALRQRRITRRWSPMERLAVGCLLLIGLAACGPASSDNVPNLGPGSGEPLSKQGPSPQTDLFTTVTQPAGPVALASNTPTGVGPVPPAKPTDPLTSLVVPAWMAKELSSSDVGTRIRALETWVQSAPPGEIDPLILAYEDKDERVRARAMELIEQEWARAADTAK